jgi:hypothetical protein
LWHIETGKILRFIDLRQAPLRRNPYAVYLNFPAPARWLFMTIEFN